MSNWTKPLIIEKIKGACFGENFWNENAWNGFLAVLILESLKWQFMPFHVRCYLRQNKQNEKWQKQNGWTKHPQGVQLGMVFKGFCLEQGINYINTHGQHNSVLFSECFILGNELISPIFVLNRVLLHNHMYFFYLQKPRHKPNFSQFGNAQYVEIRTSFWLVHSSGKEGIILR